MARIDQNTVDKIMDAAKIEDVVRSYGVDLHRAGTILKGLCPFHDEKTPSFVVSPAKGIYKCFGCGKGGHVAKFVMEKEQCSYPDALRKLAKMYNIEVPEREMTPEEKRREMERQNILEINEWYARQCTECMLNDEYGRAVGLSYFRERCFSDDSIKNFRLGYAIDKNVAFEAAKKAGFSEDIIIKSGIGGKSEERGTTFDRFKGRAIFPIQNLTGKVVAFGGRILGSMSEEDKKRGKSKYVNSPEIVGIYEKNKELYGLNQAIDGIQKRKECILVEGYADVISMHQSGMKNTVAACGTAFTERQMESIRRFTNTLVVMDDGDSAGINGAQKAANIALGGGMTVKMVLLPDNQDPDDFAKSHSAEQIQEYIDSEGMNFVEFKKKVLTEGSENDPDVIQNALNSIIETIALLPNPISRELYIKETASKFDIRRDIIDEQLKAVMGERQQQAVRERENQIRREMEKKEEEKKGKATYKYEIQEREIVQFIVRNCGETIEMTVGETKERYMANDVLLASLEIYEDEGRPTLQNPVYEKIVECVENDEVTDYKYFIYNEDDSIREAATSLMLDREVTSKRFDTEMSFNLSKDDPQYDRKKAEHQERVRQEKEVRLKLDIQTLSNEYKRVIVTDAMEETKKEIATHPDNMIELIKKLQQYTRMMQMWK